MEKVKITKEQYEILAQLQQYQTFSCEAILEVFATNHFTEQHLLYKFKNLDMESLIKVLEGHFQFDETSELVVDTSKLLKPITEDLTISAEQEEALAILRKSDGFTASAALKFFTTRGYGHKHLLNYFDKMTTQQFAAILRGRYQTEQTKREKAIREGLQNPELRPGILFLSNIFEHPILLKEEKR